MNNSKSGNVSIGKNPQPENDNEFIYRPWRRDSKGNILWAKHYGKKAWKIPVDPDYKPN